MKKSIAVLLFLCVVSIYAGIAQCEEYEKFQIKLGMHEKAVNEQYGMPIMTENLKKVFCQYQRKRLCIKLLTLTI